MKKILVALLFAGALIGGFLLFRQPAALVASPGDFLPLPAEKSVAIFIHARDMAVLGESLEKKSELMADLLPKEERHYLEAVTFKLREVAPHFGESLWLASLRVGEEIPALSASFAVKVDDPAVFLEDLFRRTVEKFPGYTVEKLEADLPEPALPLARIEDSRSGFSLYTALFSPEESPILLTSSSLQGLRDMMEAFEDPQKRRTSDEEVEGAVFLGLTFPPEVLREMEVLADYESDITAPLKVQVAFDGDSSSLSGQFFSNAYAVMATPGERAAQKPLGEEIPFVGEGSLIAFSTGRLSGLTEETLMAQVNETPDARETLEAIGEMEQATGLSLADIVDVMNGRISVVLGGGALTPLGSIPGAYLLFEPDRGGAAVKVARAAMEMLPFTLSPEKTSIPGWAEVYALDAMATFTVAADEHRLLVGLLDAGQMEKTPQFPASLEGFLSPEQYGALGLSFVELEKAVDGLTRRLSLFLGDPRIDQALKVFHRLVAPLDTLTIEATSPERGNFRLTYREQARNEQEVQ